MIDNVSVQNCALCGACINACPVDAIQMKKEYLDFQYPEIDSELCIHCNKCEKVCPVLCEKIRPENGFPIAYAAKSKNDSIRMQSSSGGIFYELASQMLQDGGYICGAVFDEHFHIRHIVSNKKTDLYRMMGSKYAQSDMGYCYREIEKLLERGKNVLFSGYPCQVAGLRTYLGKSHPNLLLVELICHGIPSDRMLQTYIGMQEKKYRAKLKRMDFRNKDKGWHNSAVRMEFENGKVYSEAMVYDTFMQGYFQGISLKESCYSCKFRNLSSGSDLVIGDFWGAEIEFSRIDDNKGISAVLVNTNIGNIYLNKLSINLVQSDAGTIIAYNKNLIESAIPSLQRKAFYSFAEIHTYEDAIKSFLKESARDKLKRTIRFIVRTIWYVVRGKEKPIY